MRQTMNNAGPIKAALTAVIKELNDEENPEDIDHISERIAELLGAYLRKTGVEPTNELIAEGVKIYFYERYRFNWGNRSLLFKILASVYINRKYLLIVPVFIFILIVFRLLSWQSSVGNLESIATEWSSFQSSIRDAYCEGLHYSDALCRTYMVQIADLMQAGDNDLQAFEGGDTSDLEASLTRYKGLVLVAANAIKGISEADSYYYDLLQSREYIRNSRKFPLLKEAADAAGDAFSKGTQPDIAVAHLMDVQMKVSAANAQEKVLSNYMAQIERLRLPAAELSQVKEYSEAALSDIILLDNEGADANIAELEYILDVASNAMELRITTSRRIAQVIIKDDGDEAKAYAIVRVLNKNGEPGELKVTDSQTGTEVRASVFGIRVPLETYDKALNGEINELIGEKPRGQLNFKYRIPVINEIITEW
jgi:hypothetical protein